MRRISVRKASLLCLLGLGGVLAVQGVLAQHRKADPAPASPSKGREKVRIREIEGCGTKCLVYPPIYSSKNTERPVSAPKQWGQIKVTFDTAADWIDTLVVRYYVLMLSADPDPKTPPYSFLEGSVTYVDVKKGNGHITTAFLRPNTLERYGEVVACAVEISDGEDTVDVSAELAKSKVTGKWWTAMKEEKKVVVRNGYLLNREQTPFALVNHEDYEGIQ